MIKLIENLIIVFGVLLIASFLAYFFKCSYYCSPEITPGCIFFISITKILVLVLFFLFIVYFICLKFLHNSKSS
jgi:hypothetical protein